MKCVFTPLIVDGENLPKIEFKIIIHKKYFFFNINLFQL